VRNLAKYAAIGATVILAGTIPSATSYASKKAPRHHRAVTYSKDVAPILYDKCVDCHRAGQVAPFALTNYDDARRRAELIAGVTATRYMPPWKAEKCAGGFVGERRLTSAQIETLRRWADSGAPEGNPRDLPPMPHFAADWEAGPPDCVLSMPGPYHVSADGNDVYRCFVIPTHFAKDCYLSGVDIHPGNRKVVHHVIIYLDTKGAARALDGKESEPGYTSYGGPGFLPTGTLGGWAPGKNVLMLPSGVGYLLPKDADIVVQVHYHPDGKPETDLSSIGLYISKEPVDKQIHTLMVVNPFLKIPAGQSHYAVHADATVPENIHVLSVTPHMHLLGRDMAVTFQRPGMPPKPMISVNDWDFNWQFTYAYKKSMALPKGSRINLIAHYDNTENNARNPNSPLRVVNWGEQTTDEMCIAFVAYTNDDEHLLQGLKLTSETNSSAGIGGIDEDAIAREAIERFDENHDGRLEADELAQMVDYRVFPDPKRPPIADPMKVATTLISNLDKNHNGGLEADELVNVIKLGARHQDR
jgi:hypothetical protein